MGQWLISKVTVASKVVWRAEVTHGIVGHDGDSIAICFRWINTSESYDFIHSTTFRKLGRTWLLAPIKFFNKSLNCLSNVSKRSIRLVGFVPTNDFWRAPIMACGFHVRMPHPPKRVPSLKTMEVLYNGERIRIPQVARVEIMGNLHPKKTTGNIMIPRYFPMMASLTTRLDMATL